MRKFLLLHRGWKSNSIMSEPDLTFMCRVESNKANLVVLGFETYMFVPVQEMPGFMDILIGNEENNWLIRQLSFDR